MDYDPNAVAEKTCVRFTLRDAKRSYPAAISSKALVECFGAEMSEAGLIASYRANSEAIHRAARQRAGTTLDKGLLLTGADLAGPRAQAAAR
ncbi:DUF1488 family protein [Orrella sp. JC864]|uniref:DUF1488 family protein n=1 Tax=Orrella sp. JC864 TaxID=3120298 RepID=UPI0012BC1E97